LSIQPSPAPPVTSDVTSNETTPVWPAAIEALPLAGSTHGLTLGSEETFIVHASASEQSFFLSPLEHLQLASSDQPCRILLRETSSALLTSDEIATVSVADVLPAS